MHTHKQTDAQDAILGLRQEIQIRSGEIGDQSTPNDKEQRGEWDSTHTSTQGLAERREDRGEGAEEKGLVQGGRIRFRPLCAVNTGREAKEDVRTRDTKQWTTDTGG